MPRVSIVLPAYNAEGTILATVESVIAQHLTDWELIAIDDGSADRTIGRLETIGDPRLRIFSHEHGGPSAARNRGISRAVGELVAFIDADDAWTPDKLAAQVGALDARPDAGVAYSWTCFVDERGHELARQQPIRAEGDVYRRLLVSNFTCSGSNILVRRRALTSVGGFDESLRVSEDWELCVRLAARWPFVVVPRHQILYRQAGSSTSATPTQWEEHGLRAIERVFASVPAELQPLKRRRLANFHLHVAHRTMGRVADDPGAWFTAGRLLLRAIRRRPALLLGRTGLRVVGRWLLLAPMSRRAARCAGARSAPRR